MLRASHPARLANRKLIACRIVVFLAGLQVTLGKAGWLGPNRSILVSRQKPMIGSLSRRPALAHLGAVQAVANIELHTGHIRLNRHDASAFRLIDDGRRLGYMCIAQYEVMVIAAALDQLLIAAVQVTANGLGRIKVKGRTPDRPKLSVGMSPSSTGVKC